VSKKSIKSDLARIDQMKDAEINYADIPPLDKSFLKRATTAWPPVKKQLTIRLDADVLAWLKAQGRVSPLPDSGSSLLNACCQRKLLSPERRRLSVERAGDKAGQTDGTDQQGFP
jgi:hypothetical protein